MKMKLQTKKTLALLTIFFFALSFLSLLSTVKADDTNLRPMSSFYAGMASKDVTYGSSYAYMDSSNPDPNNQPSMRVANTVYPGGGDLAPGEVDSTYSIDLTGLGGHTIYAGCWIKTAPYSGSWVSPSSTINLDLLIHDPTYGLGIATSSETDGSGNHYQLITTLYPDTQVPPDHGWEFCIYNFTLPDTPVPYITTTVNGTWGVFPTTGSVTVDSAELSFWAPVVGMVTWYGSPFFYIDPSFVPGPSTTPSPSPSPTPTVSPIPNTQESSLVSSPDTTIFWFGAFIVFLIASAVIAIAFFPIFGIFAGILGLIGTWWFYQAGTIIINSVTDPSTNITTTAYMPLGWLILVPIVLCVFNFMMPAIKR